MHTSTDGYLAKSVYTVLQVLTPSTVIFPGFFPSLTRELSLTCFGVKPSTLRTPVCSSTLYHDSHLQETRLHLQMGTWLGISR